MKIRPRLSLLAVLAAASLFAADTRPVVALYPDGAPGSATRKAEPEKIAGSNVSNIHHPSLTVYLPAKDKATGCAVIVAPGGGHARLAIEHEGWNVAQYLADHGVAAFVLKYRLGKDDATPAGAPQPYTIDRDALGDAQRAIKLVRNRASEWGVDPTRVGIIGFSAGGEVALLAATRYAAGKPDAADTLDRHGSRPDFFGLIYPGGLPRTDIALSKDVPPAFLAAGYGDRQNISEGLAEFYLKCKKAGISAELHMYAGAGHGFGVRASNKGPHGAWIARFTDWLADRKMLGLQ
ncbi:MAG: alpha/beta hydrolase [Verrucomicrobia bacterium]|nr:alpha/beta hydrolase [Verrucomicrobiota bacterium]